ncbi:(R)-1-hydroxy-2-aminoethylphosphonate ammonia-lyase [Roseivirga sp.]|uniref:(R)-1-hydroxy-2-aminoethylphosphonate ammonia-lyase n=1 Tax=Roseivirga sp. TaxID=1964215 RepID=UPI003B51A7C5
MAVNQGEQVKSLQAMTQLTDVDEQLLQRDADVFFHQTLSTPVFNTISKAEGTCIYDGSGKRYLDLHGNGVHTVGYNHPKVVQALKHQLDVALSFAPRRFTNEPSVKLAERLVNAAPEGLSRVLFCPGGSEAIEMAVMLAKHHTSRYKTLSYEGTFHGAGFQAVSLGADPHFRDGLGPMMPGAMHLPLPDYYRNPWQSSDQADIDDRYLAQLKQRLLEEPEVAALVTEPIFYNSTVPTAYYWQEVRKLCDEHGVLLIFDEIYTAFGRTGKMFASEHFVTPDILVVGKGFGGGVVPYAGIIGREELNTLQQQSIGHYTHEKSPFCAAAAQAVLQVVEEEDLVERAELMGAYFKEGLFALQHKFELIGNVTGLGLNLGVDLVKNRETKERAIDEAHQLMAYCFERGVSFKLIQQNILNLKPALIISKEEIDFILNTLEDGLKHIQQA